MVGVSGGSCVRAPTTFQCQKKIHLKQQGEESYASKTLNCIPTQTMSCKTSERIRNIWRRLASPWIPSAILLLSLAGQAPLARAQEKSVDGHIGFGFPLVTHDDGNVTTLGDNFSDEPSGGHNRQRIGTLVL
jgi:hypothetical protein